MGEVFSEGKLKCNCPVKFEKEPEDPMTWEPALHQYTSWHVIDLLWEYGQQFPVHILRGYLEPKSTEITYWDLLYHIFTF